ncbi:MAG: hypothetical protein D4R81_07765 [Nitrospiraceae bacterium]|nr:MAG: hypothetical protein D4R81_07765 [Nitrospiraceae bacterium]
MKVSNEPVLIYLADLSHDGLGIATDCFPLNIGLVAAYAKRQFGEAIDIKLFKYPKALFRAIRERPPDILGCSNYVWNSHLSEWACEYAKQVRPETLTVQGGTNYPFHAAGQAEFLATRPCTDVHVYYEGEVAFTNLVSRYLDVREVAGVKARPIGGCQFLDPASGRLVSGAPVERIKALDDIPSPYVAGLLDEFFDGRLMPMMETTRGCPFLCNFCNAGDVYFNKVNKFSLDYIARELEYIGPKVAALGITSLMLSDNNFGMFARDAEVAQLVKRSQDRYGWPLQIGAWTGKNSKERVIKATEILGASLSINMAVQSMDQTVLANIKRDNISLEAYKGINAVLAKQNRSQEAEIIVPLPGETLHSYLKGLEDLMDSGVRKVTSYTLQLLYGTDYKDVAYRRANGYTGKWRVVPLDFGRYEGRVILDAEEVAVSSNTMSFQDYLHIRSLAFVTELAYNNFIFHEMVKYLGEHGVPAFAWVRHIWERLEQAPAEILAVHESFLRETCEELWDSEEALLAFYCQPEQYERLLRGEAGGNVLFKHKSLVITQHLASWVSFIMESGADLILSWPLSSEDTRSVRREVLALSSFMQAKLVGVLNATGSTDDLFIDSPYHILRWIADQAGRPLSSFDAGASIQYRCYFDATQMAERQDTFKRYGTDISGLTRILAKTPTLHRLFRHVEEMETRKPESVTVVGLPASASS